MTEPGDTDRDDSPDTLDTPSTKELCDPSEAVSDGREGECPE